MHVDRFSLLRRALILLGFAYLLAIAASGLARAGEPPGAARDARHAYELCVKGAWPDSGDAERRAADCSRALQGGRLAPAEVALARLTRGVARYMLGDGIVANDDYREALSHYEEAIDPRNPDAVGLLRRGTAYGALGQTDKGLSDFTAAIRLEPGRAQAYLERGLLLSASSRAYQRAIADFNRVLELEPGNVSALIARGRTYSQLARQGEAIADYNRAIALEPNSSNAYYQRGLAYFRVGAFPEALRDYDAALRLNPRNVAALVDRGALLDGQRRYHEAIRDLDAALEIWPDNARAFYNRGYARFGLRQWNKAIADYSLAIALDPAMGIAYNNRCLARGIAGKDLVAALADCDKALKLAPLNTDVRTSRGLFFLKLGDPLLALHEYEAALRRQPDQPAALYGRGLALLAAGRKEEGRRSQAAAIALDPDVVRTFSGLGLT